MISVTRFIVNVSDELCGALDTICDLTEVTRSDVLAALIRVHIHHVNCFIGNRSETRDRDPTSVTVAEIGESVEAQFLEACATHPHELALLVKAFGLTHTRER
jgi:metal-responsive CopG/Arc/MetJ family transcriptional regulator